MPDVSSNERFWNEHGWGRRGDRWSQDFGGPDYQWWGMLYPRLHEFLPAATILEIAPGHGRWTRYLVHLCDRLIGVDLAMKCVEFCRGRFAEHPHASFHKNDGMSLEMVPDGEVDFAFSFDSLVHCEADVVESYVHELARKLTPPGAAFLHHSNLAHYRDAETGELPFEPDGWRGTTMGVELFPRFCSDAGLICIGQEMVRWQEGEHWFSDCFSMLTRPGSRFARENRVIENPDYPAEAAAIRKIAEHYGPAAFPGREKLAAREDVPALLRRPL